MINLIEQKVNKKTILIIGDSWGIPDYKISVPNCTVLAPKEHTEYRLRNLGYNVINCSIIASSMLATISKAKELLNKERNLKIDWIIWFHTESIRDVNTSYLFTKWLTLDEIHKFTSIAAYRAFKDLVETCSNPKTVVIGGQAPIDPILYDIYKPNFVIEDWRSEIVGRKLSNCVSLSKLEILEILYNTKDEKIDIMNIHQEIFDAMTDRTKFFDGCHPGSESHKELTARLHKWFSNS